MGLRPHAFISKFNYRTLAQLLSEQTIGAVGLGFDSRTAHIGHISVANDSPLLRRYFGAA